MSIDIESEKLVRLTEAPKHIPGRPSHQTVWRWTQRPNRYGILLACIVSGGVRFTSLEAIQRYLSACTAAATQQPAANRGDRKVEIDLADAELDAYGI